jgi:hypothetical protein
MVTNGRYTRVADCGEGSFALIDFGSGNILCFLASWEGERFLIDLTSDDRWTHTRANGGDVCFHLAGAEFEFIADRESLQLNGWPQPGNILVHENGAALVIRNGPNRAYIDIATGEITLVPEPAAAMLLVLAAAGLMLPARRERYLRLRRG